MPEYPAFNDREFDLLKKICGNTASGGGGGSVTSVNGQTGVVTISLAGLGGVTGPDSATDNAIARFDLATGKIIQSSSVTMSDTTGALIWNTGQDASFTAGGTGANLLLGSGVNGNVTLTPSGSGVSLSSKTIRATAGTTKVDINSDGTIEINPDTSLANAGSYYLKAKSLATDNLQSVALFQPAQGSANMYMALDLVIKGTPSNKAGRGVTWIDVCSNTLSEISAGNFETVTIGKYLADYGYLKTSNSGTGSIRPLVLQPDSDANVLVGGTTDMPGTGGLKIFGTTQSTTSQTGALRVAGGAGIEKNATIGGDCAITGNEVITGNESVTGNSTVTGRIGAGAASPYAGGGQLDVTKNSDYTTEAAGITIQTGTSAQPELLLGVSSAAGFAYIQSASRATSFTSITLALNPNGGAVSVGGNTTVSGNVVIATIGRTFSVKSGTNALAGTVTLTAGAGTIASTAIDANTVIILTLKTVGGTILAQPYVDTITPATGCTIAGGGASNTSTYNWVALKVN